MYNMVEEFEKYTGRKPEGSLLKFLPIAEKGLNDKTFTIDDILSVIKIRLEEECIIINDRDM